ncbi:hypothetical protein TUMEXPCC7403_17660 [Tumidithrix helvetica PCC 7403]|uniref:STAS domain-containing protein n=1 Tax=Tumidithrix helvetica TaxID=3457545 RepID=UPI003C896019
MDLNIQSFTPYSNFDSRHSSWLRTRVIKLSHKQPDVLVIDMQNVYFIDSCGLGTLCTARRLARESGFRLFICSLNEEVKFLLDITSMSQYFEIFSNRHEALKATKTDEVLCA